MPAPADANLAIEVLKARPTLLVTLFLGGLTVRVAQEQKRIAADQRDIARRKLNLDLFERRLKVFEATRDAAEAGLGIEDPASGLRSMARLYSEASFLFGPEVREFMEYEVAHVLVRLDVICALTRQNGHVVPSDHQPDWFDLRDRLNEIIVSRIHETFAPYLDFSDIR